MHQYQYNKDAVLAQMRERGIANFQEPNKVDVVTGSTSGYLVSDLFDLEVTELGNRRVNITVHDVAELRTLIAEARRTAPANHHRSLFRFNSQMNKAVAEATRKAEMKAQTLYAYLLMDNYAPRLHEGDAGYVAQDYPLSVIGLDELISAYNRNQEMLMSDFAWQSGRRNGRDVAFLRTSLYDENAQWSTTAYGFSVAVTAKATVDVDGELAVKYEMETLQDHSSRIGEAIMRYCRDFAPLMLTFNTDRDLRIAKELASNKLHLILTKSAQLLHHAITMRERELRGLGFDIQIAYNDTMAA